MPDVSGGIDVDASAPSVDVDVPSVDVDVPSASASLDVPGE